MVYFNRAAAAPAAAAASTDHGHKTNGEFVLAETMRWLSKKEQKKWLADSVLVRPTT